MSEAADQENPPAKRVSWRRTLQAAPTRRALLLTALGGLLIAGLITVVPVLGEGPGGLLGHLNAEPAPGAGGKGT
ncbi:hypothetical protein KV113_27705, partial [Mycolicibacter sp. MYC340]|nr:hypothetical protein [Mycolicibacter sp. MYC340]